MELLPGGAAANNILVGAGVHGVPARLALLPCMLLLLPPQPKLRCPDCPCSHIARPSRQGPKVVEALLGTRFRGRDFGCTPLVAASRNTLAIDADGNVITWVGAGARRLSWAVVEGCPRRGGRQAACG